MLDIIYEDNHIVVVLKPQNVPTQADASGDNDLLSMVKGYIKEKYNKKGEAFVGLVHRLDRPTGGVIVFARNSKSASRISAQIKNGTFEKTYYAVVKGVPRMSRAHLEHYVKKDEKENKVRIVPMLETGAKKAEMDYVVLDTVNNLSLLKINLETGKPHQIRLQLASIGTPIYGDAKYGNIGDLKVMTNNLALWASELVFKHPTLDKTLKFKAYPFEDKNPWNLFNFQKYI